MQLLLSACLAFLVVAASAAPMTKTKVNLPAMDASVSDFDSYAGYVTVNETMGAAIFYWFFESQGDPANDPFILWLTGGPGCSSELAIFYENGPYKINDDLTLSANPHSWNKNANILYVDQPVGTGFSYVNNSAGYVTNEKTMADEMYLLLQTFFTAFPQFSDNPFFLIGESYAGHYVPALAARIDEGNFNSGENIVINLKALAIGNGMTDPLVQYSAYAEYAYSHGLIDGHVRDELDAVYKQCYEILTTVGPQGNASICDTIIDTIAEEGGPFNLYDVRRTCPPTEPLCYNFTLASSYLEQPSVRKALGVGSHKWSLCDDEVHKKLTPDWFNSVRYVIPMLLDRYRVMVYNGNMGFICNFLGSEKWVRTMEWHGQPGYNSAPQNVWMVDGVLAGYSVSYAGLTMLRVNNAGHMVPMDQPAAASDMLAKFLSNTPF